MGKKVSITSILREARFTLASGYKREAYSCKILQLFTSSLCEVYSSLLESLNQLNIVIFLVVVCQPARAYECRVAAKVLALLRPFFAC